MTESRRSLLAYAAAMAACVAILTALLELWRADLRVPFVYFGDAICAQIWAQGRGRERLRFSR